MSAINRKLVKCYLLPEEKQELQSLADQARLSLSELMRRLCVGRRLVQSVEGHEAIRDVIKVNGDLARLGNLFKMAIDQPAAAVDKNELETLLAGIRETNTLLRSKIVEM